MNYLRNFLNNKGGYWKPSDILINDEMDFSGEKTSPRHRSRTAGSPFNVFKTMTESERHASTK